MQLNYGPAELDPATQAYMSYVEQVTPAVQFSGMLYGTSYSQTFSSLNAYFDWRTSIAALPESQVYMSFAAMCQNQSCDPNQQFSVRYQNANLVWNVWNLTSASGSTPASVDVSNLDGYWSDPVTFLHQGNPSWYSGYFFDVTHLIGGDAMGAHIDPFGALNPFHYLIQMPAMLFPPGRSGTAICSLAGGCTLGH